jgi:putative membrane protein
MSPNTSKSNSRRSIAKGALAGLVGGLAGAGAKMIAEQLFPPRIQGQTPPPVVLAEQVAGRSLPEKERQLALQGIHFILGALAGAVYGALVEVEPSLAAWRGAAFGITLNRLTHEAILPKLGLAASASGSPTPPTVLQRIQSAELSAERCSNLRSSLVFIVL